MKLSTAFVLSSLVCGVSCVPGSAHRAGAGGFHPTQSGTSNDTLSSAPVTHFSSDSRAFNYFPPRQAYDYVNRNSTTSTTTAIVSKSSRVKLDARPHGRYSLGRAHLRSQILKEKNSSAVTIGRDPRHKHVKNLKAVTGDSVASSLRTKVGTGNQATGLKTERATKNSADKRALRLRFRPRGSRSQNLNLAPTPAPTASGSSLTTVHINDEGDFALLLPKNANESISDAEPDALSFCTSSGCANTLPGGFITAAAVSRAPDNGTWIQVTGCLDPSKLPLSPSDDGGQFDVRFPNGAQCLFGGYGASFIEQVEPSASRFCLRCCSGANDQINCNSHQDRAGCPVAIPGVYDFPEKGISCA